MVVLVTNGVSTLNIRQAQLSADKVRVYTKFFAGVGIDGINDNDISVNKILRQSYHIFFLSAGLRLRI